MCSLEYIIKYLLVTGAGRWNRPDPDSREFSLKDSIGKEEIDGLL